MNGISPTNDDVVLGLKKLGYQQELTRVSKQTSHWHWIFANWSLVAWFISHIVQYVSAFCGSFVSILTYLSASGCEKPHRT
jgi:hypothetical protein